MSLSDPWADSLDIISLKPVKKLLEINPMGLSAPWDDSLGIIALQPVKKCHGLTQWDLASLWPTLSVLLPSRELK